MFLYIENFCQKNINPIGDCNHSDWFFLFHTVMFAIRGIYKWKVDGKGGTFGMVNVINRAIREGFDITNANFYSKISMEDLCHILRSDCGGTGIPSKEERLKCLHSTGTSLVDNFDGTFENCIQKANNSAEALLKIIAENFSYYNDEVMYKGQKVCFLTKAQLLIGDLWRHYNGQSLGQFNDIDRLTIFPNYRITQLLQALDALKYSRQLTKKIRFKENLPHVSEELTEIKGVTIYVCEQIRERVIQQLNSDTKTINSVFLDYFLYDYRNKHKFYNTRLYFTDSIY